MEQLLHYVWKHKIFPLKELKTTDGFPVEIIDPGLHNTDAGPDFFNAKIKINGTLWSGNVEIHSVASDWYRHGHDKNKAYDSVILHVAGDIDRKITTTTGGCIPQLQLPCPDYVRDNYNSLYQDDQRPGCYTIIRKFPKLMLYSWMSALQSERFSQKTDIVFKRLEECNGNWEDVFLLPLHEISALESMEIYLKHGRNYCLSGHWINIVIICNRSRLFLWSGRVIGRRD